MNELIYKQFEKDRLSGMTLRDIATQYSHGTDYYIRNGYVERFNDEHPDFPELRGRRAHDYEVTSARTYRGKLDEEEYRVFEERRLAGESIDDISRNRNRGKGYYYQGGYVRRFNREHPEMRNHRAKTFNKNKRLTAIQVYDKYIDYHRQGLSIFEIAKKLNMEVAALRQIVTKKSYEAGLAYADHSLANAVMRAKSRKAKLSLIHEFRIELIADYGKTLMDVPDEEPRLLALQLANQTLK
ncbi:hypothetical protein [Weissella minor]|uniref:Uncharacterized protein n=1 Tax=Weissella minor TaxID=1620 RepID=A0A0R2JK57_9LACO|nr:hypothetical protein [Weissella minor]KRN77600.1 hypothetical protein IV67_GL001443 [Weissella minor]